jgi:hypothetical protein
MNKKALLIIIGITLLLSTFVLFSKVSAKEEAVFKELRVLRSSLVSSNLNQTPSYFDKVRCTCNGESCGSSFDSNPNVQAGNLIVYCAQLCSCRSHVGFTYETEE